MSEFFHGWRRIVGLPMLLLACLVTSGWLRSHSVTDVVSWGRGYIVASIDSRLVVVLGSEQVASQPFDWDVSEFCDLESELRDAVLWFFRGGGFGLCADISSREPRLVAFVPYWVVVIPTTLAAAWLLLSKCPSDRTVLATR